MSREPITVEPFFVQNATDKRIDMQIRFFVDGERYVDDTYMLAGYEPEAESNEDARTMVNSVPDEVVHPALVAKRVGEPDWHGLTEPRDDVPSSITFVVTAWPPQTKVQMYDADGWEFPPDDYPIEPVDRAGNRSGPAE